MTNSEYIRKEDREEYRNFCKHHLPAFGRALPWSFGTTQMPKV